MKNPVILNAFGPYICDNEEVAFLAIQKCGANFEYCSDRLKNKLDFVKRVIPYFPEAYLCVSPELKRNKELIWQSLMRNKDMHLRFVIEDIPHELYMDKGYMTQLIKKVIENNRIDVLQCLLLNIPDQMYMNNPDFCVEVVKIASTNKNTLLCMLGGIVQGKSITNIHTYNF